MEIKNIKAVYFIGAGGIGMSAIARYFLSKGFVVAGYDKTETDLTKELEKEGMLIHYDENVNKIPQACKDKSRTLVVYSPAVPQTHQEMQYFRNEGFEIVKRAEVLGILTRNSKALCFAGTHGKTTTSTMCAHILHQSSVDCNAFLGGISKNYSTNLILSKSEYTVIEADEFDRSFHHLTPYMSVITSTDADHLDIYGTEKDYVESFNHYTSLIQEGGVLVVKKGINISPRTKESVKIYTYSKEEGDFHAANIKVGNGKISFDFVSPIEEVKNIELGLPIPINIENAVAAMALAQLSGCNAEELRYGMKTFKGAQRRFDIKINNDKAVLISDYAHHPAEIQASISSVKEVFNNRRITVCFQPHLYSRTKDFYKDFAKSLSMVDEVLLCPIYPAREKPIEGVTSQIILNEISSEVKKSIVLAENLPHYVEENPTDVLLILGAGDIDNQTIKVENVINKRINA